MLNIGLGLLKQVRDVAVRAGDQIMEVYNRDFKVETKGDASPVTEADRLADQLITRGIQNGITSDFPVISEESVDIKNLPDFGKTPFWLVDPLDGTKEFIKRNGEFTVNIALMENRQPVLGVVHLPALGETYVGANLGSFKQTSKEGDLNPITVRDAPARDWDAVVSRSHPSPEVETFLQKYPVTGCVEAGSSLKFCRVAEGKADIYPRFGRTMEWDTAAGHAVLKFAGGRVVTEEGLELSYGKSGLENPNFIACGKGVMIVSA